jgi:hypothetical protein
MYQARLLSRSSTVKDGEAEVNFSDSFAVAFRAGAFLFGSAFRAFFAGCRDDLFFAGLRDDFFVAISNLQK